MHWPDTLWSCTPAPGSPCTPGPTRKQEPGAGPNAIAFLDRWLAEDPSAPQTRHLNWHAALQALACGDFAQARRRADEALDRADVGMRSATNWRLLRAGQAPAGRCDLEHVRALPAAPGGTAEVFHTFNLALALAVEAAGDDLYALAARAADDQRPDFREVLAPVVRALAEVVAGHPQAAVDLLTGLGEHVERIGGVRVEREIVQDTLARALVDTGEHTRAAQLLDRRRTARRHHAYEDHLLAPATRPPTERSSIAAAPSPVPAARPTSPERPDHAADGAVRPYPAPPVGALAFSLPGRRLMTLPPHIIVVSPLGSGTTLPLRITNALGYTPHGTMSDAGDTPATGPGPGEVEPLLRAAYGREASVRLLRGEHAELQGAFRTAITALWRVWWTRLGQPVTHASPVHPTLEHRLAHHLETPCTTCCPAATPGTSPAWT